VPAPVERASVSARVWLDAARPPTLPAAVAPVLVGTALAEGFTAWRFVAALLVALAFQVGVNYANDYFDGVGGIDTPDRVGPRRAVASGLVAPAAMRAAMLAAFAVALASGLALAVAVGWELVVLGLVLLAAALGYSGGPRPYASVGLGEVFVFLTFGLAATAGSAYVQDATVPLAAWPAASAMGLLAAALLMVNNLRDLPTDAAVGKATLAVRLGEARARRAYAAMLAGALALVPLVTLAGGGLGALAGLAAAPLAVAPIRGVLGGDAGLALVAALRATGRLQLAVGVLTTAGVLLAPALGGEAAPAALGGEAALADRIVEPAPAALAGGSAS